MSDTSSPSPPRRILLVAMPGVQLLDVAGPLDVFAEANAQAGGPAYRTEVISTGPGREIRSSSGARLVADRTMADNSHGACDTLLVAGSPGAVHHAPSAASVAWIRSAAEKARRYGSVCTGAFILAETGLLDGHRVTTHWAAADAFERRHPAVLLERDAIHVRDGRLRTAAGVTAGLDLAVALVAEDLGREVAKRVAAQLVMFFKRPGGQMQFSLRSEAEPAGRAALQEVQRFVAAEPSADHRVALLAQRAGMSPRHFARLFQEEIGMTPGAWVEKARITAACRFLDTDNLPPKRVAGLCGFANADTLRRVFVRHLGVSPTHYRKVYSRA